MMDPEKEDGAMQRQAAALERQRAEEEQALRRQLETKLAAYGYVVMPSEAIPPILDQATRLALAEWMAEINSRQQLKAVGLKPRSRVLLDGPPGCGKTTLAHHVAARLGLPMLVVMANAINSKWVGGSAANIGKLFKASRQVDSGVVLFFDEFDAIARTRGSRPDNPHIEAEGATVSLLAEMDRHDGMIFAATNQPGGIDPAVTRRFMIRMEIGLPGGEEIRAIIRLYLKPLEVAEEIIEALAHALHNSSPALIKDICQAIVRGLVLGPRLNLDTSLDGLVRRAALSIKPHDSTEAIPRLWSGMAEQLTELRDAATQEHWPPTLPAAALRK